MSLCHFFKQLALLQYDSTNLATNLILIMEISVEHIKHVTFKESRKGNNAVEATQNIHV